MTARLDGWCPPCESKIVAGRDEIAQDDTGRWVHVECKDGDPRPADLVHGKREPCPDCWTIPAANGACGCDE